MAVDPGKNGQPIAGDGRGGPELVRQPPSQPVSEPGVPTPAEHDEERPDSKFFIVGIGASAGGLEALESLLKHVQLDGMAFVVVQHLAPQQESLLPTLLSRASHISVHPAQSGMRVEPNNIYVIPPNADLAILEGVLHLMTPPAHGIRLPVDYFFRSLAQDQGSRSIGVVLSGAGSDGTFGLKAIKEAGGITFVQDPASAKYDGMPRSAIESGWADFCLRPESIAEELINIGKHPYLKLTRPPPPRSHEVFGRLLVLVRKAFGNDLTYYKPSTIERRVERRMALHKIEQLEDYYKLLESNAEELRHLYKDMLIGVTSFFRDEGAYEALKTKVFLPMIENKQSGSHIRAWTPACATGEETYSIAMSLLEFLGNRVQEFRIQVFGTDIDEASIQHARRGIYPPNIALDVSPERLQRFFTKKDNSYHISRNIRDMVVLSVQNLTRDAPFSRLDLVSCRNLLIYLQPVMQKKVLRVMHYALNPNGFLMLGSSETVGEASDLFSLVDRKSKLYAKKNIATPPAIELGVGIPIPGPRHSSQSGAGSRSTANLPTLIDRKILDLYGPPGVVINQELEIVHIRGRTGPFLEPMPGTPSLNVLRLVRPELHVDLRRVLHESKLKDDRASVDSKFEEDGVIRRLRLEVVPVTDPETTKRCFLVSFVQYHNDESTQKEEPVQPGSSPETHRVQELERELLVTKESLQTAIDELESANQELKSSNEELQSANEELQSTNEELETSKEELQSSNEELTTVNDELQGRMSELQLTNDDLHNVLTAMGNAVVIIGLDLRIRRFTHTAEMLLNLVPGDIGRSVSQLNSFILGQRVEELASDVIESLAPIRKEILCADQRWYELYISPYKTLDHSIKGAVLVLIDVDVRKRASDLGRDVAKYANDLLGSIRDPLMILDRRLRVLWINDSFSALFGVSADQVTGQALSELRPGPNLEPLIVGTVASGRQFNEIKLRMALGGGTERPIKVSGRRIPPIGSESLLVLLSFEEDSGAHRAS
jgi:two-component system, chemotaxis family, CheB/CheR fusion protein